jgi:RNA polymerase sigma-70 factor (ECF subfamily)
MAYELDIKDFHNKVWLPLVYFVNKKTNDYEAAEDIAADTFIKVWENRDNFKAFELAKGWAYKVANNAAINSIRSPRVRNAKNILPEDIEDGCDMEERIFRAETLAKFFELSKLLGPQQRKIIECRLFGMGVSEISNFLGLSKQSVLNSISIAIRNMKTMQNAG